MSAIAMVSDEYVGTREVAPTFGAGDFARGCIETQLLVLPIVGVEVGWISCRTVKDFVAKCLRIQFAFLCRT